MKVPVRRLPQTRVSEEQQGYARAVQPLNVEPLTRLVEGFREQLLDEQDSRQRVGLNRALIQEVNELQSDFSARQRDPEQSPIDFADNTNAAYNERHTALIERLRGEGYRGELLDDFEIRLGTVRQGFYERGLGHQVTQLRARAGEEIEDIGMQASQYAGADPNNYASARDMVRESVRMHPDLTEEERAQAEDSQLAVVRDAASRAMAIQNPQLIIDTFDPQGLTAPGVTPTATGGTASTTSDTPEARQQFMARVRSSESSGNDRAVNPYPGQSASGRYQFTRRTWVNLHQQVIGGNMTDAQRWSQRFDGGLQDRLMNVATDSYERILREGGQPITPGNLYLSHFVGPDRAVRILRNPDAPLTSVMTAEEIRVNPPLRRMQTVGQIAAWTDRQMGGGTQVASVRAGATMTGGSQLAPEVQNVALPASQSEPGVTVTPPAPANDISVIRTGNALLDDLNGRERLQLLGLAREQMSRVTAAQRGQMDVTIGNITAEAMNNGGEIATPIPNEADVLRVYGPVEGPQRWAQIQQSQATGRAIVGFRTRSSTDIQAELDRIRPVPGSPTYATQLQVYQAAERAAQALLTERERDPAAYAMQYFPAVREAAQQGTAQYYAALDRVYQTLGIDTRTAPLMTSEARTQLTEQYRTMSPPQRLAFMAQNWAMGEDRFRRFVRGMEGTTAESDAQIYALFRSYQPGPPMASTYQQVLEGREIIARDPARRPKPEQVLTFFREQGLNAILNLNADASRAIQEAAEGIYVQRGGDPTNINRTLYREALSTALGGSLPVNMSRGQARFSTILPPGTNQEQFRGWMERQTLESLSALSVDRRPPRYGDLRTAVPIQDIIDEGVFVMVSPGRYMVRMASDGRPLMTTQGRPFLVNINRRNVVR